MEIFIIYKYMPTWTTKALLELHSFQISVLLILHENADFQGYN